MASLVFAAASPYTSAEWHELFVASAGAGAALAGLVFVAVSINVERILKYEGLPERALETVLLLLGVVVVSLTGLGPFGESDWLGIVLLAEALAITGVVGGLLARTPGEREHRASRIWLVAIGTVPFVIGGLSLVAGTGGGLWWTLAGMIGAIVGAVINAWVLLVEILR
jgi:hypothetical protein